MLLTVLFFIAGIVLGRLLRSPLAPPCPRGGNRGLPKTGDYRRQRVIAFTDRLTMGSICLLLFVLGLSVGASQEVLVHIGALGLQAAILSLGAIAGSVLAVQLLNLWPGRRSDEE